MNFDTTSIIRHKCSPEVDRDTKLYLLGPTRGGGRGVRPHLVRKRPRRGCGGSSGRGQSRIESCSRSNSLEDIHGQ